MTSSHVLGCQAWGRCQEKRVRPSVSSSPSRIKGLGEEGERQGGPTSVSCGSEGHCEASSFDPEGPARRIR